MNQKYLSSAERRSYAILDAYGSRSASWPAEERQATLDCIARSATLQAYQAQLEDLDARIQSAQAAALPDATEVHALQQRILAGLPAQTNAAGAASLPPIWMRLFGRWLTPRYAVAVAAMAIAAIALSLHHGTSVVTPNQPGDSTFAAWSWYDITGQELSANQTTSSALTMTDFIDLAMNNE